MVFSSGDIREKLMRDEATFLFILVKIGEELVSRELDEKRYDVSGS